MPTTQVSDVTAVGARNALVLLALAVLLSMTTWFSAAATLPALREHLGAGSGAGALLTIAVQLGFVFGAIGSALLTLPDRVGPRRLMLAGSVVAAAANAALLVVDSTTIAVLARLATGAALALVYPPSLKAMATWFERGRGMALGTMVGALSIGSALPHLVNVGDGTDWRLVVAVTSGLTLVGGLVAELLVSDGPYGFPRTVFDPGQAWQAFAERPVRLASFGYFGHMWELYAMWAWAASFGTYLAEQAGGASWAGSMYAFAVIAVGGPGCLLAGALSDRWGRAEVSVVAMLASGTCCLIIGPAALVSPWLAVAVGLVWGFTVVADSAQFSTLVTETAPRHLVGTAVTMQLAIGFSITTATIYLVPVAVDALTWTWAFAILAPGPLLGVLAMLPLRRR